ncbi:MAG: hypothetical protein MJZ07_01900 [Bacteroidales bacterium]|nr:hypothetical protein [Bacteroidales bacterium]
MAKLKIKNKDQKYEWKYSSIGGMTRVNIQSGEDIKHLGELDQKLWTVLSCPVTGLEFPEKTLKFIDSDGDGKIRVNEVVATANWLTSVLNDADLLLKREDSLPLSAINQENEDGKKLYESAKKVLENLGLEKDSISVADTSDSVAIFSKTRFNGDGIITVNSSDDEAVKAVIQNIIDTIGSVSDRSGDAGVNADQIAAFYAACADYSAWKAAAEADKENIFPYGDGTEAALAACEAVKAKVSDWFIRCKLAAFNGDSTAALDVSSAKIAEIADLDLNACNDQISAYPVSHINPEGVLSFEGVNPAWKAAMDTLHTLIFPEKDSITEADWNEALGKFAAYTAWTGAKAGAAVEALGLDRIKDVLEADLKPVLDSLVDQDKALEGEANAIDSVDKLLWLYRDFYTLLCNYVAMPDFYQSYKGKIKAVFQAGTLYIDQRALDLCIKVSDMGKQAEVASFSGMYILYCNCTSKKLGKSMTIAAVLTNGDIDDLRVGQNAVFYDRDGLDWDAVVTKIVDNPTSVRQAFWSPYRKMANTIQDRINKSAAEKDKAATANLTDKANTATIPEKGDEKAAPKAPFDIAKFAGIFAAFGMAAAFIGTALAALVHPWYMPLIVILGLVLVISGPSMFLAWLKLRKRNLGPVLNANGWAVNSKIIVNIKFGATLTHLAKYPKVVADDPFAKKKMPWWQKALIWLAVIVVVLGGIFCFNYKTGKLCTKCPVSKEVRARLDSTAHADSIAKGLLPIAAPVEEAPEAEAEAPAEEAQAE